MSMFCRCLHAQKEYLFCCCLHALGGTRFAVVCMRREGTRFAVLHALGGYPLCRCLHAQGGYLRCRRLHAQGGYPRGRISATTERVPLPEPSQCLHSAFTTPLPAPSLPALFLAAYNTSQKRKEPFIQAVLFFRNNIQFLPVDPSTQIHQP